MVPYTTTDLRPQIYGYDPDIEAMLMQLFFTPFCFSSPASQLFLIQDSNCQKNSYFCCHLPLEKALMATPIHTPYTYHTTITITSEIKAIAVSGVSAILASCCHQHILAADIVVEAIATN